MERSVHPSVVCWHILFLRLASQLFRWRFIEEAYGPESKEHADVIVAAAAHSPLTRFRLHDPLLAKIPWLTGKAHSRRHLISSTWSWCFFFSFFFSPLDDYLLAPSGVAGGPQRENSNALLYSLRTLSALSLLSLAVSADWSAVSLTLIRRLSRTNSNTLEIRSLIHQRHFSERQLLA